MGFFRVSRLQILAHNKNLVTFGGGRSRGRQSGFSKYAGDGKLNLR